MIVTDFQPLLWLYRDNGAATDLSVIQPEEGWLETCGFTHLILRTHLMYSAGTHYLFTETCDTPDGLWEQIGRVSAATPVPQTDFFASDRPKSDFRRMRRYVRWRWSDFDTTGTAQASFRLKAMLKR